MFSSVLVEGDTPEAHAFYHLSTSMMARTPRCYNIFANQAGGRAWHVKQPATWRRRM